MSGAVVEEDGGEVRLVDNVKALGAILRRRWLTLVLVSGVIFAIAAVLIMLMVPTYQATARIQLDPNRDPLARAQNPQPTDLGSEFIETEVTVLNSQDIAKAVVDKLRLDQDPEFTKGLDRLTSAPAGSPQRTAAVVRAVKKNLVVGRDRLTYVINVGYKSTDPTKAADIANAFAEAYIAAKVNSRVGTAGTQAQFFERQLAELGDEVRSAEAAAAQYRARTGIVKDGGAGSIVDQQIGPLSTQLATAESEAAEARAALAAARGQIARGGVDAVSEVRSSPVISDLRRQRAEVLRNLGEVSSRYGPRHPESIKINQQLSELDAQIKAEANRAIGSLEAAARAADARVASLRGSMRQLESQQAGNTRASVTADSLEREADSKRAAYDKMAQLSVQSVQGQRSDISQATIIDPAVPPSAPDSPRRAVMLAMALMLALAAGSAVVIAQELLVPGIRSVGDFESQFGIPMLAAVPRIKGKGSPADLVSDRSTSLFGESVRIARASILGVRHSKPVKVIAFTSSVPAEGKTTTALSFARTLAISGARTLLIDCDVRRASLRALISTDVRTGLVEVLGGQAPLASAIIADTTSGLDLLTVAQPYFSSEDLFGGDAMAHMLNDLRGRYDQIILDLPPVLGLADARFLAALGDAVVLIVRWGKTPASAVGSALRQLNLDEVPVVGAIFTMVDPSSEAIGGVYYSKKYGTYYRAK